MVTPQLKILSVIKATPPRTLSLDHQTTSTFIPNAGETALLAPLDHLPARRQTWEVNQSRTQGREIIHPVPEGLMTSNDNGFAVSRKKTVICRTNNCHVNIIFSRIFKSLENF